MSRGDLNPAARPFQPTESHHYGALRAGTGGGTFVDDNMDALVAISNRIGVDNTEMVLSKDVLGSQLGIQKGTLANHPLMPKSTPAMGMEAFRCDTQFTPVMGGFHESYRRDNESPLFKEAIREAIVEMEIRQTFSRDKLNQKIFGIQNIIKLPEGVSIFDVFGTGSNAIHEMGRALGSLRGITNMHDAFVALDRVGSLFTEDRVMKLSMDSKGSGFSTTDENESNPLITKFHLSLPPIVENQGTGNGELPTDVLTTFRKRIGNLRYERGKEHEKDRMTLLQFLKEIRAFANFRGGISSKHMFRLMMEASTGDFRDTLEEKYEHTPIQMLWDNLLKEAAPKVSPETAIISAYALNAKRPTRGIAERFHQLHELVQVYTLSKPYGCRLVEEFTIKIGLATSCLTRWWPSYRRQIQERYVLERNKWVMKRFEARERGRDPDLDVLTSFHLWESLKSISVDVIGMVPPTNNPVGLDTMMKGLQKLNFNIEAVDHGKVASAHEISAIDNDKSEDEPEVLATNVKVPALTTDIPRTSKASMFCPYCLNVQTHATKPTEAGMEEILSRPLPGPNTTPAHWPKFCPAFDNPDTSQLYSKCKECFLAHPPVSGKCPIKPGLIKRYAPLFGRTEAKPVNTIEE